MKIIGHDRKLWQNMPVWLPGTTSIRVKEAFVKNPRFENIINKRNLSALDNYLEHEKAIMYVDVLDGDLFHNVKATVYKRNEVLNGGKHFFMKLDDSKDAFVKTMRDLYKNVESAITALK